MSLLVYAGASQFLAVEMISKGIPNFSIILATFFINLRHILMSSNLSVYLRNVRIPILGLLSAQMTDESYAVAISKLPWMNNRPHYLLGLQIISQLAWVSRLCCWCPLQLSGDKYGLGSSFCLTGSLHLPSGSSNQKRSPFLGHGDCWHTLCFLQMGSTGKLVYPADGPVCLWNGNDD